MLKTTDRRAAALLMQSLAIPAALLLCACQNEQKTAEAQSETPAAKTEAAPPKATAGRPAWNAVINGKEEPAPDLKMGDQKTIMAILDEGKNRNKVMDHLKHLTGEIGPRLTGSKRAKAANDWCAQQYTTWGLSNVQVEQWGEFAVQFNRGPCKGTMYVSTAARAEDGSSTANSTKVRDLEFTTPSWSIGTKGPVRGPVVWMPQNESEYASVKSKLKGAWVLTKAAPAAGQFGVAGRGALGGVANAASAADARKKVAEGAKVEDLPYNQRIYFDGINGVISSSRDDRVSTGGRNRNVDVDKLDPDIVINVRRQDYDALNSRVADGENVELEFDLQHEFVKGPVPTYNTIAEIKGTTWPDQVVIISAHLDSWDGPGSQGATDNGTGSSTTLEAARILAAVGAKPKRTIRFVNWTGEEQGLMGSRAYVAKHKDEMEKISACFVDDGGTNYSGGLQCAEVMLPMLAAATAPANGLFKDDVTGAPLNCNLRPGPRMQQSGGSDHMSFNSAGVPGFFWTETGRSDYGYGWHTQNDKYGIAIPVYLQQSSTLAALVAYQLACADTLLPRDPRPAAGEEAPAPAPGGRRGGQGGGGQGGGPGGGNRPAGDAPATPGTPAAPAPSAPRTPRGGGEGAAAAAPAAPAAKTPEKP